MLMFSERPPLDAYNDQAQGIYGFVRQLAGRGVVNLHESKKKASSPAKSPLSTKEWSENSCPINISPYRPRMRLATCISATILISS